MIAMFDIFTLLYKEAKELISKWFYRFPKGKTQKCSSSHQFVLQRKGIYGRNESEGKAKSGVKKQRHCRKGRCHKYLISIHLHTDKNI